MRGRGARASKSTRSGPMSGARWRRSPRRSSGAAASSPTGTGVVRPHGSVTATSPISATSPPSKRDRRRDCSPVSCTGGRSLERTICRPACCKTLKTRKNSSCVRSLPASELHVVHHEYVGGAVAVAPALHACRPAWRRSARPRTARRGHRPRTVRCPRAPRWRCRSRAPGASSPRPLARARTAGCSVPRGVHDQRPRRARPAGCPPCARDRRGESRAAGQAADPGAPPHGATKSSASSSRSGSRKTSRPPARGSRRSLPTRGHAGARRRRRSALQRLEVRRSRRVERALEHGRCGTPRPANGQSLAQPHLPRLDRLCHRARHVGEEARTRRRRGASPRARCSTCHTSARRAARRERLTGDEPVERALQLAHSSPPGCGQLFERPPGIARRVRRTAAQDRHARLELRHAHVHHEAAREPLDQALVHVGDLGRRPVARADDLPPAPLHRREEAQQLRLHLAGGR